MCCTSRPGYEQDRDRPIPMNPNQAFPGRRLPSAICPGWGWRRSCYAFDREAVVGHDVPQKKHTLTAPLAKNKGEKRTYSLCEQCRGRPMRLFGSLTCILSRLSNSTSLWIVSIGLGPGSPACRRRFPSFLAIAGFSRYFVQSVSRLVSAGGKRIPTDSWQLLAT